MTAVLSILLPLLRRFWPHILAGALALATLHFWHRAIANAEAVRIQATQFKQAQDDATKIAQDALHHQEAQYQAKAQEADHAYQTQLAAAQSAADRYIAGHRVRADGASGASATPASASGSGAAVPESLPADAVVVSAGDVQACTSAVTYGVAAHDWALGLDAAAAMTTMTGFEPAKTP